MYGMKTTKLNQSQFANALPIQRTSSLTGPDLTGFLCERFGSASMVTTRNAI
jgi:hypothetical protein